MPHLIYSEKSWSLSLKPPSGLFYGDGVFETLRTYSGLPFLFLEHFERLRKSARALKLKVPPASELKKRISEAVEKLGVGSLRIRILLLRRAPQSPLSELILFASPFRGLPRTTYQKGVSLTLSSTVRLPPDCLSPQIKTISLQPFCFASLSKRKGFDLLYRNRQGFLCETTTANLFIVSPSGSRAKLLTPHPATGILPGVTASLLLTLAPECGLSPEPQFLTLYDLFAASEAFITNSLFEILPVVEVEGRPIGRGKPGKLTYALHSLYRRTIADAVQREKKSAQPL